MNASERLHFEHLLIRASAGTGKTFQLSNRFLGLLHKNVPVEKILATTFTRKAAGEILDRVLVRLAEAALDKRLCEELAEFIQATDLTTDRCLDLLAGSVRRLHRLRISTIDGFFAQIARSFSLELGLPAAWQIVDEHDDRRLRDQAIDALLQEDSTQDLRTLTHLLTQGETKQGVRELIRSTISKNYTHYHETSEEAWQQIPRHKQCSDEELDRSLDLLTGLSFENGHFRNARDKDHSLALAGDWEAFLAKGLAGKISSGELLFYKVEITPDIVAVYRPLLNHARAVLLGLLARQTESTYHLLDKFHQHYQRLKQERSQLRFEDITNRLAQSAVSGSAARMAFRLDAWIDNLLLDEFQDTSIRQWQVIRPLAQHTTSAQTKGSFFCVGDIKQAIYGWRGGVAEIFEILSQELEGLQIDRLNRSFRSSLPVIEAVNTVFSRLTNHSNLGKSAEAVQAWSQRFEDHSTARGNLPGYVRLLTSPLKTDDTSQGDMTLAYAATHIVELVEKSPGMSVGVLVRTNKAVRQLVSELQRLKVYASEEGGNPLTDSAAVQLVLSLLKLADHPGDKVARFHLASSPLGSLLKISDHDDDQAAMHAASRIRRQLLDEGYGPAIYHWAKTLVELCHDAELRRLKQLVQQAYLYQDRATLRPGDFIQYIQNQKVSDPQITDVRVMTVHQAKGLQFDIVVLPELDKNLIGQPDGVVTRRSELLGPVDFVCRYVNEAVQNLLPDSQQQAFAEVKQTKTNESLCGLYVAITRAVHHLSMIIAPSKPSEKSLPATSAGLLRATLSESGPAEPETVLYQCGDPRWYERIESPVAQTPDLSAIASEPLKLELAPGSKQRRRGLSRASPSSLEGGRRVKLAGLLQPQSHAVARRRGTLIHAWLEQILWLEQDSPAPEKLREIAQQHLETPLDINSEIERFQKTLAQEAIARLFSQEYYRSSDVMPSDVDQLKVFNEYQFAVRDGNELVTGSIDRLVLAYQAGRVVAAEVIDFKTDALPEDDPKHLAEKVEFYRPQLTAYCRAAKKIFNLSPETVTGRLVFLGPGVVARV